MSCRLLRLCIFFFAALAPSVLLAQKNQRVDYYRSPYPYAVEIDPLGAILKRVAIRFEYRIDPLMSRYGELEYHLDLRGVGNAGPPMKSITAAYGTRIYLRDNAAME